MKETRLTLTDEEKFRKVFADKGYTFASFARETGVVSRSTLTKICKFGYATESTAVAIADELGVYLEDLSFEYAFPPSKYWYRFHNGITAVFDEKPESKEDMRDQLREALNLWEAETFEPKAKPTASMHLVYDDTSYQKVAELKNQIADHLNKIYGKASLAKNNEKEKAYEDKKLKKSKKKKNKKNKKNSKKGKGNAHRN